MENKTGHITAGQKYEKNTTISSQKQYFALIFAVNCAVLHPNDLYPFHSGFTPSYR
ncbi:hypothetical protein [uncultured Cytophaga sp.]|uniref:hypothetical protein n=1 Tax=uncultured Cytophaga sp. TaxID=160238 RepID=UPI002623C9C8|nr:hypothetical protein [uncultured Cytophaga sp.]